MPLYVALLRGINVGGNNKIKMNELAAYFESLGFTDVRTYIQSGNVIFRADEPDQARLRARLEAALSEAFQYDANLMLREDEEMRAIVAQAPEGFGSQPEVYRYNVLFLQKPIRADEVIRDIPVKEGVDQAFAGDGVLYFSHLMAKAGQSRLSRIIQLPVYKDLTIRNWNTTTKLAALMKG